MSPIAPRVTVSVVIPCYNLGQFLEEAVRSVWESHFPGVEVIVVDDGSTEPLPLTALKDMAAQFDATDRFSVIRQNNQGVSAARNTGIQRAAGAYVLPLDADDKVRPGFLAHAAQVLDSEPEVGVVYGHLQRFGVESDLWEFSEFNEAQMLMENQVPVCAVARKKAWADCGGFDSHVMAHEDWEFWINVMRHGWKFRLIREIVVDYRARENSEIGKWGNPEVRRDAVAYICRKHRDLYTAHLPEVLAGKELKLLKWETLFAECRGRLVETAEGVRVQEVVIKRLLKEAEERESEMRELRERRWWQGFRRP